MDEAPRVAELSPEPVRSEAADVGIGLWTVGNSSKVGTVARIAQDSIHTHLAGHTAVLIHVDTSVPDEAREQVEHPAEGLRVVRVPLARSGAAGRPQAGWCEAVRAVLSTSRTLHTRAVVMLNAGLSSTTPEWIRGLAQPVLKDGCGFVLPVAAAEGALPLAQSVLGPRLLEATGQQSPLGATVGRVAGSLFSIAERHEAGWLEVRGSEPVALFGTPPAP